MRPTRGRRAPVRTSGSPFSGTPPLGGAFFVYHHRSTEFTIGPKPCSRIHSTVRAPIASVPGARSAST